MKVKVIGYLVMEWCDNYEQALSLMTGPDLPEGGVLDWATERLKTPRAMFSSRSAARAAINRTEHYRLAYGSQSPERKFCSVVPVGVYK